MPTWILSLLSVLSSIGLGIAQNVLNKKSVDSTNESNLQAVRETNQSNVEQSELAYSRSLPIQQLRNLMDAGFSRAGAVSHLTGAGSYSAPVLQSGSSQANQFDFSNIASAVDRASNIPTNVEQLNLIKDQRNALALESQIKLNNDRRAQELHDFDIWQKTYGKKATEMIDQLSNFIVQKASENNISLDDIDSIDKLVDKFHLHDNNIWLNMPSGARMQILNAVRSQAAENRSVNDDLRASAADARANDANEREKELHIKRLQEFTDKHNISELNINDLVDRISDYEADSDVRRKERKLKLLQADLNIILTKAGLSEEEFAHQLRYNDDGSLTLMRGASRGAKEVWQMLTDVMGISTISDLLGTALSGVKLVK